MPLLRCEKLTRARQEEKVVALMLMYGLYGDQGFMCIIQMVGRIQGSAVECLRTTADVDPACSECKFCLGPVPWLRNASY